MEDYFDGDEGFVYEDHINSEDYIYENSYKNLYGSCIEPSISQISIYIGKFLIWNLAFRLTTQCGMLFIH